MSFRPNGVHLAQVRIDPDTCAVVVERFVAGYDIGRAVNPMLVEGQIAGGVVQGIGAALLEEFVHDPSGQPLAVTFAAAVDDALGRPGDVRQLPITPDRLHALLAEPPHPRR